MILWHIFTILSFFPFFASLSYINQVPDEVMKTNKTNLLARDVQSHSSSDEKYRLLNNIEEKLQKAAQHLGSQDKNYVTFIMQGIKSNDLKNLQETVRDNYKPRVNEEKLSGIDKDQHVYAKIKDNIATKIKSLIDNEFEELHTSYNKHNLLEIIKERVLEYVNEKQKSLHSKNLSFNSNLTRRFNQDNIEAKIKKDTDKYSDSNVDKMHASGIVSNKSLIKTLTPMCQNVLNRTCSQIKSMNSLKCIYDDTVVSLDKLCDGIVDCPDGSDEKHCASQAMERMQNSNWVIGNIKSHLLNNNCFEISHSKVDTSNRNQVIQNVLAMQKDFRDKYKDYFQNNDYIQKKDHKAVFIIKTISYEIAISISSFALALEGALCSYKSDESDMRRQTHILDNDQDEIMRKEISWPPTDCKCNRGHCNNCTNACKRICWHQNSLTLWNCESIHGTDTVSLNALCDGKLDCLDESDETDCLKVKGYEKFEAHQLYSNLLKMIKLKASKENSIMRKKLFNLRSLISELQEVSTKYVTDTAAVKTLRNKCYSLLKTIYWDKLVQSYIVNESEETYSFLLSINENLGAALKRSHTGNSKIIADGCYCRNGLCATTICSKVCVKACSVEDKLMTYNCKQNTTVTVSLDQICDNKNDCPNGFDELNCKKDEVCRRHHLIVLRRNLQEFGEDLKGTALGELLLSWKTKVISSIKFAEKNRRPRPRVLKNIIKDILRDLLVTYGTVEDYRRSYRNYALPEFLRIAESIMETIKSCGK